MKTVDDVMPMLRRWAEVVEDVEEQMGTLGEIFGAEPESPMFTAVYAAVGLATEAVAAVLGCSQEWLEWYALENEMGQKGLEAGFSTVRPIRNLDDLAQLLVEDING